MALFDNETRKNQLSESASLCSNLGANDIDKTSQELRPSALVRDKIQGRSSKPCLLTWLLAESGHTLCQLLGRLVLCNSYTSVGCLHCLEEEILSQRSDRSHSLWTNPLCRILQQLLEDASRREHSSKERLKERSLLEERPLQEEDRHFVDD